MTTQTVAPPVLGAGARILILQLQQLGDSVAVTPVVRAIRRTHPDATVDVLAGPTAAEIYRGWPLVRRTYILARGRSVSQRIMTLVYALYTIRRERYDCVLACTNHVSLRHGAVAWLSGARNRIGFEGGRGSRFFTHRLPIDPARSCYEDNVELARAVGAQILPADARPPDIWTDATSNVADGGPCVVVHPGSNWQSRTWYPERWAALSDQLAADGYRPIFVGLAREEPLVTRIRETMRMSSESLVGKTSVAALAALLRRSALSVGTDSGPRHIAAAVGCPQVTLMSAQDRPHRWQIPGSRETLLRAAPPCAGCLRSRCAHRQCMEVLGVQQVLTACRDVLRSGVTTRTTGAMDAAARR